MLNTRCYRCGWSFTLSREAVAAALNSAVASGVKYHVEHCPRCRQTIKLPIDQLKRAAPPGWKPLAPEALAASLEAAPPAPPPPPEAPTAPTPPPAVAILVEAAASASPKPVRKRETAKGTSSAARAKSKAPTAKKTRPARPARKKATAGRKAK